VQVVALSRDDAPDVSIVLVRCAACSRNVWHIDGVAVAKERALAALSAAYTPKAPRAERPAPAYPDPVVAPARKRTVDRPATELAGLLSGWQVLGAAH
jgi:hypothetical protein